MNFLNQHIYSEILKGLNGVNTDNQLFLGYYTPKILVECGMPNLPLMTNSSHLKENIFFIKRQKWEAYLSQKENTIMALE